MKKNANEQNSKKAKILNDDTIYSILKTEASSKIESYNVNVDTENEETAKEIS